MDANKFEAICKEIETSSIGLKHIVAKYGVARSNVMDYIRNNAEAADRYARAKEAQMDYLAEEILEISDDSSQDTIMTEKGKMEDKEWTNRSRLRVDTRKWLMSKLAPKKYGDKLDVTSDGKGMKAFVIELSASDETDTEAI